MRQTSSAATKAQVRHSSNILRAFNFIRPDLRRIISKFKIKVWGEDDNFAFIKPPGTKVIGIILSPLPLRVGEMASLYRTWPKVQAQRALKLLEQAAKTLHRRALQFGPQLGEKARKAEMKFKARWAEPEKSKVINFLPGCASPTPWSLRQKARAHSASTWLRRRKRGIHFGFYSPSPLPPSTSSRLPRRHVGSRTAPSPALPALITEWQIRRAGGTNENVSLPISRPASNLGEKVLVLAHQDSLKEDQNAYNALKKVRAFKENMNKGEMERDKAEISPTRLLSLGSFSLPFFPQSQLTIVKSAAEDTPMETRYSEFHAGLLPGNLWIR